MVATESNMLPLGTQAPPFKLQDSVSKNLCTFSNKTQGKGFLIAFICNHCPYVVHLKNHLPGLFNNFLKQGLKIYAISANDQDKFPADSPEKMAIEAKHLNFAFPYLFDESQEVAKSYKAACTPDFFLFDRNKELFYRGQYDDSRPNKNLEVTGNDITNAVNLMLQGKDAPRKQIPSLGCNIKWK
jgi:peroxiredoxin